MCQISAKSEHAFVFYGEFCEVCEMKKMKKKKKKKKKTKKLKRNFVRSYLGNGWSDFLQIWYVDYPSWAARLQQIWFQSDKGSQSYIGVKIAFSFFLLIYSRCGAPASWAARHTIVCLDKCNKLSSCTTIYYVQSNMLLQALPSIDSKVCILVEASCIH